jgi:hypothetical protein
MFEPLFARLSDQYHLIAPDYPGLVTANGRTRRRFAYTFDHYADIISHFTESLGLEHYTLYMRTTEVLSAFGWHWHIRTGSRRWSSKTRSHNEGLGVNWNTRRAFWADRAAHEAALRANLLSLATTRTRHVGSDPNVDRYDPDLWTDEFAFLSQPGQAEIQTDLFYDYRTNVEA